MHLQIKLMGVDFEQIACAVFSDAKTGNLENTIVSEDDDAQYRIRSISIHIYVLILQATPAFLGQSSSGICYRVQNATKHIWGQL